MRVYGEAPSAPESARYSCEEVVRALHGAISDKALSNRIDGIVRKVWALYGVELDVWDVIEREIEAIRSGRHTPPPRTANILSCLFNWMRTAAVKAVTTKNGEKARFTSLTVVTLKGQEVERYIKSDDRNPEQMLTDAEDRRERQQLADERIAKFKGDPVVQQVIKCIEDGVSKPQHIAEQLQIPVKDVYAIYQKLRRALSELLERPRGEE
jgi:hypothetical protein